MQTLWNNHFLMDILIWCGPWRVVNICLTKQRFFLYPISMRSIHFLALSFAWKALREFMLGLSFSLYIGLFRVLILTSSLSFLHWQFVNELVRVAAPGATIIIVTWCHRDLAPSEEALQPWEKELLNKICKSYYLPAWCSTADYVKLLESLSLQVFTYPIGWKRIAWNSTLWSQTLILLFSLRLTYNSWENKLLKT